jgi:hypothetical protein
MQILALLIKKFLPFYGTWVVTVIFKEYEKFEL